MRDIFQIHPSDLGCCVLPAVANERRFLSDPFYPLFFFLSLFFLVSEKSAFVLLAALDTIKRTKERRGIGLGS